MGDSYVEQLVKRQPAMRDMALRAGSIVSGILITYILMVLIGIIALVGVFAIGYGIYYLFMMTDVEFEYTFINGELTIDKIYGKNKRKRAAKYDLKKCELICGYKSSYAVSYNKNVQMKMEDFTSGSGDEEKVYLIVVGYGAGNAKVYIEPSEELIAAIKSQVPNKFKKVDF